MTRLIFGLVVIAVTTSSSVRAQSELVMVAVNEFLQENFSSYEDVKIEWSMDGPTQADLNEGINYLFEHEPRLAEASLTRAIERTPMLWAGYYYRAIAKKQQAKLSEGLFDIQQALLFQPDSYEAQIEQAKIYFLRKEPDRAEKILERSIRVNPRKARAYLLKGDIQLMTGQQKKSTASYEKCLQIDHTFNDARVRLAVEKMFTNGSAELIRKDLNQALSLDSLHKGALFVRSLVNLEDNKRQSLKDLDVLLRLSPNAQFARFLRGVVYSELGEFDDAFADFQSVIKSTAVSDNLFKGQQSLLDKKIDIQNAGAYMLKQMYGFTEMDLIRVKRAYCHLVTREEQKAIDFLQMTDDWYESALIVYLSAIAQEHGGSHNSAFQLYNRAIELDPEIPDAYKKRAIYHMELKEWQKAISDLSEVLRIAPDAFVAYKLRGIAQYYAANYVAAIADFDQYLLNDEGNREVLGHRGMGYLKNNQRLLAYADFAASRNYGGINQKDLSHVLDSTWALKDTVQLIKAFDQMTIGLPAYTNKYIFYFQYHFNHNNWSEIEARIEVVLAKMDRNSDQELSFMHMLLAMVKTKRGELFEALEDFNQALKKDKGNTLAWLERGRLWQRLGDPEKARNDWETAAKLGSSEARELLISMPRH